VPRIQLPHRLAEASVRRWPATSKAGRSASRKATPAPGRTRRLGRRQQPRCSRLRPRQRDREPHNVELSKAIVCAGAHGRLAESSQRRPSPACSWLRAAPERRQTVEISQPSGALAACPEGSGGGVCLRRSDLGESASPPRSARGLDRDERVSAMQSRARVGPPGAVGPARRSTSVRPPRPTGGARCAPCRRRAPGGCSAPEASHPRRTC
jgi:hypothetical protein